MARTDPEINLKSQPAYTPNEFEVSAIESAWLLCLILSSMSPLWKSRQKVSQRARR